MQKYEMVEENILPLAQHDTSKLYILNKKFGTQILTHEEYMEYIANYVLNEGLQGSTCAPQRTIRNNMDKLRLTERAFHIKYSQRQYKENDPNPMCKACNFTQQQMVELGFGPHPLPYKMTTYWCAACDVPLCITPCFEICHTVDD